MRLLAHSANAVPWPYANWVDSARRSVRAGGLELPDWLLVLLRRDGGVVPQFLTPAPTRRKAGLEDELTALREVQPCTVWAELRRRFPRGYPAALKELWADPRTAICRLADLLVPYWKLTIAQFAAVMRSTIEEDILLRSRILAMEGPESLLDGLPGGMSREGASLSIPGGTGEHLVVPAGGIRVVPLLFGGAASLFATGPDDVVFLSYQSRGAAVLGQAAGQGKRCAEPGRGDRLEIILGRSRAALIRALTAAPTTTSALASQLGLAVSTVSEHLTALVAAGLVKRYRVGVRVLYELDGVREPLLPRSFDDGYAGAA
jgi:DNA-binding transcriptional ArsR family regulator